MRSLRWTPHQYDWCPYRKRRLGHRCRGKTMWRYREKMAINKPRRVGSEETLIRWSQVSILQNCEKINICGFKPLSLWYLLWQLQPTNTLYLWLPWPQNPLLWPHSRTMHVLLLVRAVAPNTYQVPCSGELDWTMDSKGLSSGRPKCKVGWLSSPKIRNRRQWGTSAKSPSLESGRSGFNPNHDTHCIRKQIYSLQIHSL